MAKKKKITSKENNSKNETKLEGPALDELVNQCLVVTDRNGEIIGKDSTPVTSYLAMEYQSDYGKIIFEANSSAMGNGSYNLKVKDGRKTLLNVYGSFTARPFNNHASRYVSGDWEKKVKLEYQQIMKNEKRN